MSGYTETPCPKCGQIIAKECAGEVIETPCGCDRPVGDPEGCAQIDALRLQARVERLEKDTERLDWLIENEAYGLIDPDSYQNFDEPTVNEAVRKAIDKAKDALEGESQ